MEPKAELTCCKIFVQSTRTYLYRIQLGLSVHVLLSIFDDSGSDANIMDERTVAFIGCASALIQTTNVYIPRALDVHGSAAS